MAVIKFNRSLIDKNGVIVVYEKGEELIGGVDFFAVNLASSTRLSLTV